MIFQYIVLILKLIKKRLKQIVHVSISNGNEEEKDIYNLNKKNSKTRDEI